MAETITTLLGTPIPTLLVLGGIVFIFLAIFPVKIIFKQQKPSAKQQILSAIAGIVMLLGGISLYLPAFSMVLPTPSPVPPTDMPTSQADLATDSPAIGPTAIVIQNTPVVEEGKIAITEIMSAPCDSAFGPNRNEYLELYNYGKGDVDVNGWWITTNGTGTGIPDLIVSWDTKNLGITLSNNVITNTTIIPTSAFAIILSPHYYVGEENSIMPYRFPNGTILLTLQNSDYLGIDETSLLGNTFPFSVLVLYQGTESIMSEIISTFGTPTYGSSPKNIQDDRSDDFPSSVDDCYSSERINVSTPDVKSNWRVVENGNPGTGDYGQP